MNIHNNMHTHRSGKEEDMNTQHQASQLQNWEFDHRGVLDVLKPYLY